MSYYFPTRDLNYVLWLIKKSKNGIFPNVKRNIYGDNIV